MRGAALVALLLAGCASAAPDLPADTTGMNGFGARPLASFAPADAAMPCEAIGAEFARNNDRIAADDRTITDAQTGNEVAVAVGGAAIGLTPVLFAANAHMAQRREVVALTARNDTLRQLAQTRGCFGR